MSSFLSVSSSSSSSSAVPFSRSTTPPLLSSSPHSLPPNLIKKKGGVWGQGHRALLVRVNCSSKQTAESSKSDASIESSSSSYDDTSSVIVNADEDDGGDASYKWWCAGLGGIGFVETAYLSYLKLANVDALCPMGGASCTTILTSDYSSLFGVPLPLFGMLAYGLVTTLGLQLGAKKRAFNSGKTDGEIILIGVTTSMAVASAYFLYILRTEFGGELCLYCLASAALSFSLFFITLKRFGLQELQKILGLQLFIAGSVVIALTASYSDVQSVSSSLTETEIPYFETEIVKESSPLAISLAKHLRSIGAKLYGAFWCSHCLDQKEMFGREAAKLLDYVECFPDGVSKGTKMAQACSDVKLEGFPSWEINGQILSGDKQLSELAALSGVKLEDIGQSN